SWLENACPMSARWAKLGSLLLLARLAPTVLFSRFRFSAGPSIVSSRFRRVSAVARPYCTTVSMDRLVVDRSKWAHRCSPETTLVGGILQREHVFRVPLDWSDDTPLNITDSTDGDEVWDPLLFPSSPYIDVFVREVVKGKAGQANEEKGRGRSRTRRRCCSFCRAGQGFPARGRARHRRDG
ncbi:unnamed protein product, partial [Prorocentrum cordatum]